MRLPASFAANGVVAFDADWKGSTSTLPGVLFLLFSFVLLLRKHSVCGVWSGATDPLWKRFWCFRTHTPDIVIRKNNRSTLMNPILHLISSAHIINCVLDWDETFQFTGRISKRHHYLEHSPPASCLLRGDDGNNNNLQQNTNLWLKHPPEPRRAKTTY